MKTSSLQAPSGFTAVVLPSRAVRKRREAQIIQKAVVTGKITPERGLKLIRAQ